MDRRCAALRCVAPRRAVPQHRTENTRLQVHSTRLSRIGNFHFHFHFFSSSFNSLRFFICHRAPSPFRSHLENSLVEAVVYGTRTAGRYLFFRSLLLFFLIGRRPLLWCTRKEQKNTKRSLHFRLFRLVALLLLAIAAAATSFRFAVAFPPSREKIHAPSISTFASLAPLSLFHIFPTYFSFPTPHSFLVLFRIYAST